MGRYSLIVMLVMWSLSGCADSAPAKEIGLGPDANTGVFLPSGGGGSGGSADASTTDMVDADAADLDAEVAFGRCDNISPGLAVVDDDESTLNRGRLHWAQTACFGDERSLVVNLGEDDCVAAREHLSLVFDQREVGGRVVLGLPIQITSFNPAISVRYTKFDSETGATLRFGDCSVESQGLVTPKKLATAVGEEYSFQLTQLVLMPCDDRSLRAIRISGQADVVLRDTFEDVCR